MVSESCNHRCDYCFVHGKKPQGNMPLEVARQTVRFMFDNCRYWDTVSFLFFGGEPLLNWPAVMAIVELAEAKAQDRGKKLELDMTTNGTLFGEEMLAYLRKHRVKFLLSIDGDKASHDAHRRMQDGASSYERVVRLLPLTKRYQPWQGTRMTVHPDQVHRMAANVRHLHGLGINQFVIGPATGLDWSADHLGIYEDQMYEILDFYAARQRENAPFRMSMFEKNVVGRPGSHKGDWGCGAGRGRVCVGADGSLYGCGKIHGVDPEGTHSLLGDVWTGYSKPENRWPLLDAGAGNRLKCQGCEYADDCCGGCPAASLEATGSFLMPSELDCALVPMTARIQERARRILKTPEQHGRFYREGGP